MINLEKLEEKHIAWFFKVIIWLCINILFTYLLWLFAVIFNDKASWIGFHRFVIQFCVNGIVGALIYFGRDS